MRPGGFFRKVFIGNALLLAFIVIVCLWLVSEDYQRRREFQAYRHQVISTQLMTRWAAPIFDAGHSASLNSLARAANTATGNAMRVTLILPDGAVLGDSDEDPSKMVNHADRTEVIEALRDGVGHSHRWSTTVKKQLRYVAIRVGTAEEPAGIVRTAVSGSPVAPGALSSRGLVWKVALALGLACIVLWLGLSALWSRRISRIAEAVDRISRGDLEYRLQVGGFDEVGILARSLNHMRDHLVGQLRTNERQRRTLESLLAQVNEGVIVTNAHARVILINPAAADLLALPLSGVNSTMRAIGLAAEELIPHHELQKMLMTQRDRRRDGEESYPSYEFDEARIEIERPTGRITILARASDIQLPGQPDEADNAQIIDTPGQYGRILVLTDITELSRTVQMKVDFAANASHELRTPLSAIRASVETLQGMKLDSQDSSTVRFLSMIERQCGRLEALVADLLDLSRLESPTGRFTTESMSPGALLDEWNRDYEENVLSKGLDWVVDLPHDMPDVIVNPHLLRLVLDNLVQNAVKFTEKGHVAIRGSHTFREIIISVEDTGCGIPIQDQSRVFERFYQVEKSRKSDRPGTGLGLSIVRHAVAAMNGRIQLKSKPGSGSTFVIYIPRPLEGDSAPPLTQPEHLPPVTTKSSHS